jgi:hypothetical protein
MKTETTQIKITENNKLIAEFMGDFELVPEFKPEPDVDVTYCWKQLNNKSYGYDTIDWRDHRSGDIYHDRICYNTSWNWLMPVVENIQYVVGIVTIDECSEEEWAVYKSVFDLRITASREVVYRNVVGFIKWYNNQNK